MSRIHFGGYQIADSNWQLYWRPKVPTFPMRLSSFPCFWPWIDVIFCHIPIPSHELLAGSLVFLLILWVIIIPNKFGRVTPKSPF